MDVRIHTHALIHASARTHAQTQKYVMFVAFHGNSGFRRGWNEFFRPLVCYMT
jgi:hypothetical protein